MAYVPRDDLGDPGNLDDYLAEVYPPPDPYGAQCQHPGCEVEFTIYPGYGRPRRWCHEHGTPAWAMRRKRTEEKRRGVPQLVPFEEWPTCCRENAEHGMPCSHGRDHERRRP